MFCAACGKELKQGKKFCIYCGALVSTEDSNVQNEPEILSGEEETEILTDETVIVKNTLPESDQSNEPLDQTELVAGEEEATLCLGLGTGSSNSVDEASARFSQSVGAQKTVLKYMDHVIDESKVRGEKFVSPNTPSSGPSVLVKVLILILIFVLIAVVGIGVYFLVNSQKPEKAISAPEINVEEEEN